MDTPDKRGSAVGVGSTPGVTVPLPDGSVDAGDRAHLAGLYSGLAEVALSLYVTEDADTVAIDVSSGEVDAAARSKRASAAGMGLTPGITVPIPDGTIDAGDRAHLAGMYSGLAAGETIFASLDATEGFDTVAASASVQVAATLNVTEEADTIAVNASSQVQASLEVTEAADSVDASVEVHITSALNVTEAADTVSVSAGVVVTGSLSVTEASDTIAVNASSKNFVTVSVTEAADVVAVDIEISVESSLGVVEAADSVSVDIDVHVAASLAVTEARDVAFFSTLPVQDVTPVIALRGKYVDRIALRGSKEVASWR